MIRFPRSGRSSVRFVVAAALLFVLASVPRATLGQASRVRGWEDTMVLPTYIEGLPDPNPPFDFFGPRRINYPYTIRDNLTDRRAPRAWRTLNLENEFLRCTVLPDLGGHLYSCTDKVNGADVFYANPSIKLTQIGYRGAWAALGVEFNFPVSHNWMSTSPVDFAVTEDNDGSASVWIGNIDRVYGMHWLVRLTLRPGRAMLEQHTTLYNRSDFRHRFYWWTNAAVEVWDDSRILYPMEFTASHGFRDIDTWPVDSRGTDNSVVGNHLYGPVSRFSHGSREPYMAVYHSRTNAGVVHYSAPSDLPAKKVWSWGGNADGLRWREALSDDSSAYVEIQRGLFRNQETYGFLQPHDVIRFSEYWIPTRDLDDVTRANPEAVLALRREDAIEGRTTLVVALNVTRELPDAIVTVRRGRRGVRSERVSLSPERTYRARFVDLPADEVYTVEVLDRDGTTRFTHTEGAYDYTPAEEIDVGPVAAYEYPSEAERSEGDIVTYGDWLEREGRRLEALAHYRAGLQRFPNSVTLRRAAGRLAVILKQPGAAIVDIGAVLNRVSNDYEAAYYHGHAFAARGDTTEARRAWENAQRYGVLRPAAQFALAGITARGGDRTAALAMVQRVVADARHDIRAGGAEVALLRALGHTDEARERLAAWRGLDPTNTLLRVESAKLHSDDAALWRHLAGDPERILEIVVDYVWFGLFDDALALLARDYPREGVVAEPGMPHPADYPLIAYYRGYVRGLMGNPVSRDFEAAATMPTTYVFPNRHETGEVLRQALAHDPHDATAHYLLGAWYLSGGMADEALREWDLARQLNPQLPVLHRNMGYAVLRSGGPPERAAVLFDQGMTVDAANPGLYFGLDEALRAMGESAGERAGALLQFPRASEMPAALVYHAARTLIEARQFDEAEALFRDRFFPSEEGGTNVREVWLEVRIARAGALAASDACDEALAIVDDLARPVDGLVFTQNYLEAFLQRPRFERMVSEVRRGCESRN